MHKPYIIVPYVRTIAKVLFNGFKYRNIIGGYICYNMLSVYPTILIHCTNIIGYNRILSRVQDSKNV